MADLSELLDSIPVGDIAKKLGIDESVAEAAVKQVLPGLVGGMAANASDSAGAASLEKALGKHGGKSTNVDDIDTDDGEKIVSNIFGSNKSDVVKKVASSAEDKGVTQKIIEQVLPIVAPIVLAWLASQFLGGKKEEPAAKKSTTKKKTESASAPAGGGIGDILGGLVSSSAGQDMIGGLLGGLLGGGKK